MFLKKLELQSFRSFSSNFFEFNSPITLIIGPNAIGKTSIIEAIQLLSNGISFRADRVEEMIEFNNELGRVKGIVSDDNSEIPDHPPAGGRDDREGDIFKLDILLTRGMVQGKRSQHTLYSVNNIKRRKKDFVGKLLAVSFRPEDMRLVEGSPARRRQFIDTVLCLVDENYAHSHKVYLEASKKRNKLLWQIKEGLMGKQVLSFWNLQLLKHGEIIQKKRVDFFRFFNTIDFALKFQVNYKLSLISEKRLQEYQSKELIVGHTLIGPHKDDFEIKLKINNPKLKIENQDINIGVFGSRGQQRLAVLWLKICELEFIEKAASQRPIFLLDDIMSELDETSQSYVLKLIDKQQTIITSADNDIKKELVGFNAQVIEL